MKGKYQMKIFNLNFNSIVNVFVLSMFVVIAVYMTGFIVTLIFAFVSLVLYIIGSDRSCDNIISVIGCLLQCIVVAVITVKRYVLLKLKTGHILLSFPVVAILFLCVERFFFLYML